MLSRLLLWSCLMPTAAMIIIIIIINKPINFISRDLILISILLEFQVSVFNGHNFLNSKNCLFIATSTHSCIFVLLLLLPTNHTSFYIIYINYKSFILGKLHVFFLVILLGSSSQRQSNYSLQAVYGLILCINRWPTMCHLLCQTQRQNSVQILEGAQSGGAR